MATLKSIRSRIKAAKNIQQITRAMKLVAAARFKRATDRVLEARPYANKLIEMMGALAAGGDLPAHPLMTQRPTIKKACMIVVTSDRGLAGAYNTAILRKVSDYVAALPYPCSLIAVGRKANQFFSKRGFEIPLYVSMPSAGAQLPDAIKITETARQLFESGEVDAIFVCYSKFFSAIRQVPTVVQLLPITPPETTSKAEESTSGFNYEPDAETVLNTLLPRYFQTQVWQSMLEATASEFGARMTSMTNATDNAGKMIASLTLKANRERQASITKEILEVVGGAEALNA
ncbi:MAG: ATP synthase F1 subunit gamma [Armatimonadetes bacterium]|nr:ATP synthase F1 subunit gamma [Armatimonadota bacterium]